MCNWEIEESRTMVAVINPPDQEKVLVEGKCPQCPNGGYDIISGARRQFLLNQISKSLEYFQENGDVENLFCALQTVILNGLAISDMSRAVSSNGGEELFIGCREITTKSDNRHIEITVVENEKRYVTEVKKSQISPIKTFDMSGCPLVSSGEQPGCNPETCEYVLAAKDKTTTKP